MCASLYAYVCMSRCHYECLTVCIWFAWISWFGWIGLVVLIDYLDRIVPAVIIENKTIEWGVCR